MATPNEERQLQIIINAQQANASIKDMDAAVGLLRNQLRKMSEDDPRREQLKKDFQELKTRVKAANDDLVTYVQTEEQARAAAERLTKENQQVILNGQKVSATFNEMDRAGKQLEAQLKDLSADDPGRKKMLDDYQALQHRIEGVKQEMGSATQESGFFKQALGNAFAFATGGGIAALAGEVVDLGKDIFETTAKFETYESVMTNALGDRSKAQQAMKDIQQMAAKTPFSVDELTGSFIKFVNRGLNPSMEEMTKMADIAASQGKSFDQLTEAVLDAGGGEFERLKEFGIKASKSGDEVSLSFKGVNQTVKNTPEAINGAIMAFGAMKGVAGSTAAISKTLEGQWSNLGDTAGQLEVTVGQGLKPMFTFLLGLFAQLLGWVGRFVTEAAPLKSLFSELADLVQDFYHEIGDVLESLGLFSDKTDTVKMAVEALKVVLTVLLIPIKATVAATKGMVDLFIDWYNKSELLRGVLGGLGAVVVSLFTTIKDDAIKILGGVGDILIGIFTLDKNKIAAGFKAALSATADVALEGGQRAAEQFAKGYLANKDNHITRTVRVKTATEGDEAGPAGVDLKSDASGADAAAAKKAEAAAKKAQVARDKAAREHLTALKQWLKEEGDLLEGHDVLTDQLLKVSLTQQGQRRQDAEDKIFEAAKKHMDKLTGLESDYSEQVRTIQEERDQSLRELQAKFAEEDEKNRQKELDEQLKLTEAEMQEQLAYYQLQLADKLLSQMGYDELVYQAKQTAKDRELDLIKQKYGVESAEYKKFNAEKIKEQAAHNAKSQKLDDDVTKFKKGLSKVDQLMNSDAVKFLEDNLGKQTVLYKAFQVARKLAAAAKIEVDLVQEIQGYWAGSSEFGPAGIVWAGIQSGIAVVRAGLAMSQLSGYAKGGATGEGMLVQRGAGNPVRNAMSMAMGLGVGSNGKLVDEQGLEVAGIVHRDEYVIPAWMREDPQVLQVENWLEARRQRGFYDGGNTTQGDTRAQDALPAADQASGSSQLVQVLVNLDQRLQGVETWATQLTVSNDLLDLSRELEKVKKVQNSSAIRKTTE
jgi:hypothetical protein